MRSHSLAVVVLAAGRGTRMKSDTPKALQKLCGKPMLWFLLQRAGELSPKKTAVVAGHRIDSVRRFVGRTVEVVEQKELLGSGHAVMQAAPFLRKFKGSLLVLYCDTPLISSRTLRNLLETHRRKSADCTLLSTCARNPWGYGRIQRHADGTVRGVVEENAASPEEKKIREINVGCVVFRSDRLWEALKKIRRNAKKNEYYLTDVIGVLAKTGRVEAVVTEDQEEVLGVNTRRDLVSLQRILKRRVAERWLDRGVDVQDPDTTTIEEGVEIGADTSILPYTVIQEGSKIGRRCVIGPFARIRGGSRIGEEVTIGNFVEVVRSTIGDGTQVKHLSYIGDAEIGSWVNVGAGSITANYDGKAKRRTVIKDRAQIGSGTVLIAPVTVGRRAVTGAGAVVTKGTYVADGAVVAGLPARPLNSRK